MRRHTGVRATLLAAVATLFVVAPSVPATAAPTTPTPTTSAPTGTPKPSTTPAATSAAPTSATPSATGTPGPASSGIPATFTGRLEQLRAQAATLQADLVTSQNASTTAITTYNATTVKVQQALAAAADAEQQLATANTELDAARTEVQVLARDTYVERLPHTSSALLLTDDVDNLDFTVAALGYLAERGADVYDRFTAAAAKAEQIAASQQDSLDRAKTLQATADRQRVVALTALATVQTQRGTFLAAVTSLRDDAAKAAAAAPMSAADTAAYQTFLAELTALGAGSTVTGGTTYVTGGPGQTPLPGTKWVKPLLSYTISSCYCARWGTFHHGVDLSAPSGTPIYAVGAGTVVAAGPAQGFGNWVVIDHHDGSFSIYGHMRVLATVVGAAVTPGALIAYVGDEGESTGFHLHFEVRVGSYASAQNSTDPVLWLAQRGVTL